MSFNGIEADDAEVVPPPVSSFPRRGRDVPRVVRLNASTPQQLSGLLSPPSGSKPAPGSNFQVCSLLPQVFAPSASMPAHAATVPVFKRIPSALLYFPLP